MVVWWLPACRACGRAEPTFVQVAGDETGPREHDRVFGHFRCAGCDAKNYLPAVSYVRAPAFDRGTR